MSFRLSAAFVLLASAATPAAAANAVGAEARTSTRLARGGRAFDASGESLTNV